MTTEEAIRLAKRVADVAGCSRADAERYIAGGWVSVDGAVAEDPATRVTPEQKVELLPGATPVEPDPVTILMHKPAGIEVEAALATISADTQVLEHGRGKPFLRRHLFKTTAATPLETMASGLIVFSQDFRVIRKLVDDASRNESEYVVEVDGQIERLCGDVGLRVTALRRLRIGRISMGPMPAGGWRFLRDTDQF